MRELTSAQIAHNRENERDDNFYKRTGIYRSEKQAMFIAQGKTCAACGCVGPDFITDNGKFWHLDHDHNTNKIRGVLCRGCNLALGHTKDSKARLQKLIEYLQRWEY